MCPSPACRARLTKSALHSGYGNAPNGAWYIAAESYGDIIDWENGDTKETGEKSVSEDVEEEGAGGVFVIIVDDCGRNDEIIGRKE
jgi:hypothetical protein